MCLSAILPICQEHASLLGTMMSRLVVLLSTELGCLLLKNLGMASYHLFNESFRSEFAAMAESVLQDKQDSVPLGVISYDTSASSIILPASQHRLNLLYICLTNYLCVTWWLWIFAASLLCIMQDSPGLTSPNTALHLGVQKVFEVQTY